MYKNIRKLTAILIAAVMILSTMTTVFAEGTEAEGTQASGYGITEQSESASVKAGETAVFKVTAQGKVRSYQWQVSTDGGENWEKLDEKGDTLSVEAAAELNGNLYRCAVTFKNYKVAYSTPAMLTVKVGSPAVTMTSEAVNGVTVSIDAPEGALPEGATMEVGTVNLAAVQNAIDKAGEFTGKAIAAVDITFFDASGAAIEPSGEIKVTMTSEEIAKAANPIVVHIPASAEEVEAAYVAPEKVDAEFEENKVVFESDQFSVYVVIDNNDDPYARATVNFYNGTNLIETYYVKNKDSLEDLVEIVPDPGVGELADGQLFIGWSVDDLMDKTGARYADSTDYVGAAYQTTTKPMTIEEVRKYLEGLSIHEGDIVNVYAMIFKYYTVTYYGLDEGISLGSDIVLLLLDGTSASYKVSMAFTAEANMKFMGWKASDETWSHINGATANNRTYDNNVTITITGDVVFDVVSPTGHWLVYIENGSGATYNAPEFYLDGEVTKCPATASSDNMHRQGYSFGGWFTDAACTAGNEFVFGSELEDAVTTIYAKWIPNTEAPYTVIMWVQNIGRTGYNVKDSYVNDHGAVGQNIPYTFVDNGDEDYVTGVGSHQEQSGNQTVTVANGHYTGFCLTEASKNQEIVITPEGNAVLNLYYDRITYNFKFYLYRDNGSNYDYANNSGNGSDLNGVVTWHTNQSAHPSVTGYTIQSEVVDGRTYHYFTISAYYEEDISSKWPTYDKITGVGDRQAVSYVMMVGTKLKPNPTNQGSGTVKGIITVMNENILGATNDANGNYVVIRFPDSYYNWRYHIWYETVPGEDYTGKTTHDYNGKTYYEDTVLVVRSSNTTDGNQNEPKYQGFDYVTRLGQNNNGTVWQGGHWTTTEGNTTLYHLNYVYNRQVFKISYFDGQYVNGDNANIQNKAETLLHESPEIPQGATIADEYRNYTPEQQEAGYVFEGWYIDEACRVPVEWSTMPVGGINVYAKWRLIQYRVFLHPNAETEETNPDLWWGRVDQAMNFRISFGGKVSTPTGVWTDGTKEFVGWFTDEDCTKVFDGEVVPLREDSDLPFKAYDQTDYTDVMDQWGTILPAGTEYQEPLKDEDGSLVVDEQGNQVYVTKTAEAPYNSDARKNRTWITKKLDLYAKWRDVLIGADGITVVYNAIDNSKDISETDIPGKVNNATTFTDSVKYLDDTDAVATAAATPDDDDKYQFLYWVVQKWDATANNNAGGFVDVYETKTDDEGNTTTSLLTAFPGDSVTILAKYSKIVDDETGAIVTTAIDGHHYTYTFQLRAEYGLREVETPTYVDWYQNEESITNWIHQDKDKQINELIQVYDLVAQNRDANITIQRGHVFLGWSIQREYDADQFDEDGELIDGAVARHHYDLTEANLDLKYDYDTGKYLGKKDGEWVEAKGVAADEIKPYEALYAVWQNVFYVVHSDGEGNRAAAAVEVVPITDELAREAFTSGASVDPENNVVYTTYYYGGYGLIADTEDADPAGFTLTKGGKQASYTGTFTWSRTTAQKSGAAFNRTVGDIYYIKEVPSKYLAAPMIATVTGEYGNGDITSLSIISIADTSIYRAGGISGGKGTFAKTFTMSQNNGSTTTKTAQQLFGFDGMLIVKAGSVAEGTYELRPYWTTYDSITVNSNSMRKIKITGNTVEDVTP